MALSELFRRARRGAVWYHELAGRQTCWRCPVVSTRKDGLQHQFGRITGYRRFPILSGSSFSGSRLLECDLASEPRLG